MTQTATEVALEVAHRHRTPTALRLTQQAQTAKRASRRGIWGRRASRMGTAHVRAGAKAVAMGARARATAPARHMETAAGGAEVAATVVMVVAVASREAEATQVAMARATRRHATRPTKRIRKKVIVKMLSTPAAPRHASAKLPRPSRTRTACQQRKMSALIQAALATQWGVLAEAAAEAAMLIVAAGVATHKRQRMCRHTRTATSGQDTRAEEVVGMCQEI